MGSNLVERLVNKNHEIIVFDNGFRGDFKNLQNLRDKITFVDGDVRNAEHWKKLPRDIEMAYHLAAINGTKYFYEIPEKVLEVNVGGTLNFVNWINKTSIRKIFFASSSEVYGFAKIFPTPEDEYLAIPDPKNPRFSYASSKVVGETITINYARSIGIDFLIARFHNVYGPRMGFEHVIPEFIRKCVRNEPFVIKGDGSETRSFCYVSDAIDGIIIISEHANAVNEIFNIGTTDEIALRDIVPLLEKIHGKKITPVYEEFKNPGTKRRVPDISKISKFGYKPKIQLEEGLKNTYAWYADYYKFNNQ